MEQHAENAQPVRHRLPNISDEGVSWKVVWCLIEQQLQILFIKWFVLTWYDFVEVMYTNSHQISIPQSLISSWNYNKNTGYFFIIKLIKWNCLCNAAVLIDFFVFSNFCHVFLSYPRAKCLLLANLKYYPGFVESPTQRHLTYVAICCM